MTQSAVRVALLTSALITLIAGLGVLLWPIVGYPIRADDQYWVLTMPPRSEGSALLAYVMPFSDFGADGTQVRVTAAAYGERRLAAVLVMAMSVWLSSPPVVAWAVLKLALLALVAFSILIFLTVFRYWVNGRAERLSSTVVLAILLVLPVVILAGAEVQTFRLNNGWVFYPVLTYTPIVWYLGVACALIGLERLSLARWNKGRAFSTTLVVAMGAFLGVFLNFTYEVVALAVPLGLAILFVQAGPHRPFGAAWWRSKLVVALPFGGAYTTVFLMIRARLADAACLNDGTCYEGTLVQFSPSATANNVLAALPYSASRELVGAALRGEMGRSALGSVALAAVVVLIVGYLAFALYQRRSAHSFKPHLTRADRVGLLWIVLFFSLAGLGISVLTSVTVRAVERLDEPLSPYRSGPTTWIAFSVALCAAVVLICDALLRIQRSRAVAAGTWTFAVVTILIATAVMVGAQHAQNVGALRVIQSSNSSQLLDQIHREVALGDVSDRGDARRCSLLRSYRDAVSVDNLTTRQTIAGAESSFRLYHGSPFCSRNT